MVWETILSEFPDIEGKTVLAAIAPAAIAADGIQLISDERGPPHSPCR